jgi:hypothetical protein
VVAEISTETAALLEQAPELGCEPTSLSAREEGAGVIAAITCEPPQSVAAQLTLEAFEDADALRTSWQEASTAGGSLEQSDDACRTNAPGTRKWGFGSIACLVEGDVARISWTDARTSTLGSVVGASDDIPALYGWWRSNGRALGRTDEPDTTTPPEDKKPEATPKPKRGKLVRVPGKPKAISCVAISDPIPDEWGRTWRLTTINFENERGYERVLLNLKRTGKNRSNTPTRALIERMPVSKVRNRVPTAPTPSRGRVAIVVDLDGVREAPRLRAFRPSGLDLVREVSVVRSDGGTSVVIAAPQRTCYELRIPIWGPNATGKEQQAQVFIDLKQR